MTGCESTPQSYLDEGARLYRAKVRPLDALRRWRMPKWLSVHRRVLTVELTTDLRLRVRDPKTGVILAESEPGRIDKLRIPS